jgi:murein DD-endopeptidase MepM/ murein hydrolase activator NlpD
LAGIDLSDLHGITSQGFSVPSVFVDDGHPAVDLAFFTFEDLPSMYGHPVQSVLPGKVVMVLEDRFPYGSMILIETPLEWLADDLLPSRAIPTPIPDGNIEMFSPCNNDPLYAGMAPVEMSNQARSLYVLYSHLLDKPAYEPGEMVAWGEVIGAVGLTGNTVAEHLHLEMRIGPSDVKFNSFAMYKPEATIEERYYYCNWSSSGRFQPIDPAQFWDK